MKTIRFSSYPRHWERHTQAAGQKDTNWQVRWDSLSHNTLLRRFLCWYRTHLTTLYKSLERCYSGIPINDQQQHSCCKDHSFRTTFQCYTDLLVECQLKAVVAKASGWQMKAGLNRSILGESPTYLKAALKVGFI